MNWRPAPVSNGLRVRITGRFYRAIEHGMSMKSCVLAYSGGLDTSVILGWVQDEGYEVHCVYVDLGQPCEDRQAILKKARDCGAKSSQIVDAQEELCRDFA